MKHQLISNYYQIEKVYSNPREPDKNRETTNYTPHVVETNSNMNIINTKQQWIKYHHQIEKNYFFLETPK